VGESDEPSRAEEACRERDDEIARLRAEVVARTTAPPHCPSCTCGRRAPVQSSAAGAHRDGAFEIAWPARGDGTILWEEYLLAHGLYSVRYPGQSAERLAARGGLSYGELCTYLGRAPASWRPV
jgi:hypothetical protein